jgi:hypothetical protein
MKISTRLAALAVVALAPLGAVLTQATPVAAATQTTACFKWSSGPAYSNQPVYLMSWDGAKWVSIRSGKTNANGCGTFYNVPSNRYLTMKGYQVFGDNNIGLAMFEGWPPRYASPGTGAPHLGTGYVGLAQCTWGLYGYCAGF